MKHVSLSLAALLLLAACSPPATAQLPTETAVEIPAESPAEVAPTHTAQLLPTQAPTQASQPVELAPLDVGPLPEMVAYSQNFLHLYAGASFDFDAGSGISVPIPPEEAEDAPEDAELIPTGLFTADIRYVPFDLDGPVDAEIVIAADAPALVALWGDVEPSLGDCQDVSLAEEPLALADLTPGTFVCFLTDTDSYGYFQVVGRYFDPQQAWTETLDITYTIWDAESREALTFPALQAVRESTLPAAGADLDYGGNRRNVDLNFALPNEEQAQIFPTNGARLSYWGKASFPDYDDCASLTMDTEAVVVEKNPPRPVYLCYQTDEGRLGRMAYFDVIDDLDELEDYEVAEPLFVVATDTWGMPRGDLVTADPQANYNTLQLPYRTAFDFDYGTTFTSFLDTEFAYIDVDDNPALLPNAVSEKTKLAVWGTEEPTLADCQEAALSKDTLMLADLPIGTFICMQTSWGGNGYLRIDDLIPDPQNPAENLLALSYKLWAADGTLVVHSPLRAIVRGFEGETGTDLDTAAGSGAADVNFRLEDEFVAVLPANGANLGLWGSTYPAYQDCAAITLSNENPVLVPREPYLDYEAGGVFLCYRTNEGNLGRMFFLDEIGGQFVFDAETWAGP